ncbi:DedA family protein [Aestuariimicrobium sp. T2.26MG-19.2B]|uniref:DedA family protein n=1 Tax=Aestuariimicrobium sp. T2.26MG-19.2B TaxID=3040679 RepID=UPI0024774B94|nr:DedA family protein [Aestuariimicrobium sp. T2.26MG-19.2B]CAI9403458.1 putative membrane protein [Aestuariimicrobium sp. T2.26MG-19.2B]
MQRIVDAVLAVMAAIGAPGVGVATAAETVFPPIPSEVVLPLAGFAASQGKYGLVEAILWATAGSMVGALTLYYLGRAWGEERLTRAFDRLPLVEGRDVTRSVDWFARNGRRAVLVGRLVPGVRSLISIPAGIQRMPLLQFCFYTLVGSAVWNALLVIAGFLLGQRWHIVENYMGVFSTVVYVVIALLIGWFVVTRLRHRRRRDRRADHEVVRAEESAAVD